MRATIFISRQKLVRIDDFSGVGWITFGSLGNGINNFSHPYELTVQGTTRIIYVADTFNNRIVRFDDMTGTGWTSFGAYGFGTNHFYEPGGLSIAP